MLRLVGILFYTKNVFDFGKRKAPPFLPSFLGSDLLPSTSLLRCRSWAPSFSSPPHHPHLIPHKRLLEVALLLHSFSRPSLFFCLDHPIVTSRSKTDPNFGLKIESFAISGRLRYPILPLSFLLQSGRFSSLVLFYIYIYIYIRKKIRSNDYDLYLFVSS